MQQLGGKGSVFWCLCLGAAVVCFLSLARGSRSVLTAEAGPAHYDAPASGLEVRPDGAERLTSPPPGASDQNPAFAPDGRRLVFTRFENGYNQGPAGLFLLDLETGQASRLTPFEDQDNVNLPGSSWNAVNNRILLASDRLESNDIWRIAPDGSDFSRITNHSGLPWYFEPSWSPDGAWIVFEVRQPGGSEDGSLGRIWKVRADGSQLTRLIDNALYDDRQPNWSPDGNAILFQRRALPDGQWDIYVIDLNGGGLYNVTNSGDVDETDASWAPDSTKIVVSSNTGGRALANIFAYSLAGGGVQRITVSSSVEDGAPSWSPDGAWVAFESHESSSEISPSALWRIRVSEPEYILFLPLVRREG